MSESLECFWGLNVWRELRDHILNPRNDERLKLQSSGVEKSIEGTKETYLLKLRNLANEK